MAFAELLISTPSHCAYAFGPVRKYKYKIKERKMIFLGVFIDSKGTNLIEAIMEKYLVVGLLIGFSASALYSIEDFPVSPF